MGLRTLPPECAARMATQEQQNKESAWRGEEDHSDPSSFTEGLRERVLPFGWFEELQGGAVRFVTDHSGSVPLYYAQDQGHVLAGTSPLEVADQMAYPKVDPVSAADFLLNGTVCYPHTLFEDVYAVRPGAVTDISYDNLRSTVYYTPTEETSSESAQEWGQLLREKVQEALLYGLEGKKFIKVLFSGGEDARAVVSLLPNSLDCELVTFADEYNREVRLAEQAAQALGRPLRFIRRPKGFYRRDLARRVRAIGGAFDIRHTHVWGALSEPLSGADAVVGGYAADTLFKSAWMGNVTNSKKRLGPERLLSSLSSAPVGIEATENNDWIDNNLAAAVMRRRLAHHERIREFRPNTAGNWHTLWPLGTQRVAYAHYLAARKAASCLVEPFLAPPVYELAARMPDEMRVDRHAFRAAFGGAMGTAGWLPTSSGRIPRLGGYLGHWVEVGTIVSRRARDRAASTLARAVGRRPANQGAWSSDHGAFPVDFNNELGREQVERLRGLMAEVLSERESAMFFDPEGGSAPDLVRTRALQLAYLMDI